MKDVFIIVLLFIFAITNSLAQADVTLFDENVNPGALLDEMPLKPREAIGSFYLNDSWENADIQLKNGMKIENYPIKYDLQSHQIEIKTKEGVKVLGAERADGFVTLGNNQAFTNVNNFKGEDGLTGFFEILYSGTGSVSLLKHVKSKILPANYVPETDMGRRHDKIEKEEIYFFEEDGRVFELSGRKRRDLSIFIDGNEELEQYVKKERISFKDEADLIRLVSYYDSLKNDR